jgi:hypothetical protein
MALAKTLYSGRRTGQLPGRTTGVMSVARRLVARQKARTRALNPKRVAHQPAGFRHSALDGWLSLNFTLGLADRETQASRHLRLKFARHRRQVLQQCKGWNDSP